MPTKKVKDSYKWGGQEVRLFDYLQQCSLDEFTEWLYCWTEENEQYLRDKFDTLLCEYGLTVDKVSLSPELRKSIILQGLESELYAT